MSEKKESFISSHIIGWVLAAGTLAIGGVIHSLYEALMSQAQAYAAADQLEDSMASWMIHQQASYGDLIPNLIIIGTVFIIFLCLLPTIRHGYRLAMNKD